MNMRVCIYCKIKKSEKLFSISNGKYRNECKKCRNVKAKEYRAKKTSKEKQKDKDYAKEYYYKRKKELLRCNLTIEEQIDRWIKVQLWRKNFRREKLDSAFLKKKCLEAKEKFPYISFFNLKELNISKSCFASIDKICPDKGYTNDNVQILPLWLNSAKLDQSEEELIKKIKHYLSLKNANIYT